MGLVTRVARSMSIASIGRFVSLLVALSCWAPLVARSADNASAGAAAKPQMVALIVEQSGSIRPAVQSYTELAAGAHLELAPKARLTLAHYAACKRVFIEGGSVVVTERTVEVKGATSSSSESGPCPNVHRIVVAGNTASTGALISRGALQPEPRLAPQQRVVLVGERAPLARDVRILDSGERVIAGPWPVAERAFFLADARTLLPGEAYTLQFEFRGDVRPLKIPFTGASTGADALFVLRLE